MKINLNLCKKILYWLFIVFLIVLAIQLVRKITGGSWGFEELIVGLLIANLGYSFHLKGSINRVESKLSEHIGEQKGYDRAKNE